MFISQTKLCLYLKPQPLVGLLVKRDICHQPSVAGKTGFDKGANIPKQNHTAGHMQRVHTTDLYLDQWYIHTYNNLAFKYRPSSLTTV